MAVKTLKDDPTGEVQKSFAKFMSRLKDDNVIRLLGICTSAGYTMEYMENGDLNQYLQQIEFTTGPNPDEITLPALVDLCFQIAGGMKFVFSSHKFIHRDLATRNILDCEDC